jgi:hypothetical protein
VLHLQNIVCGPLNVLADRMAVSRSTKKRPQDELVKTALKKTDTLLFQICHGRQSTLNDEGRRSTITWSRRTTEQKNN